MYTIYDPDEYVVEMKHETCEFHKRFPGMSFPGCTCFSSYGTRIATPEEREENKKRRLEREEKGKEAQKWLREHYFGYELW